MSPHFKDFKIENVCILKLIKMHFCLFDVNQTFADSKKLRLRAVKPFRVTDIINEGAGIQIHVCLTQEPELLSV